MQDAEPRFYQFWRHHQVETDPQLDRWIVYEGNQVSLARERVAMIQSHFSVADRRVLDLGSQWGATTIALAEAGAYPVGLDISPEYAAGASVRAEEQGVSCDFAVGLAEQLPFPPESFDSVVCVNVIEHVSSHARAIAEVARVMKRGGHVYLDGPNRLSPHWLRSDPHYRLRGISILPPWLGRPYVTRVRGFPSFDVGRFPVASLLQRQLETNGLKVIASSRTSWLRFNIDPMFWMAARRS